jgi:hypothetical protein
VTAGVDYAARTSMTAAAPDTTALDLVVGAVLRGPVRP